MSIITIGIDLAKIVFAVHGVNEAVPAVWSPVQLIGRWSARWTGE